MLLASTSMDPQREVDTLNALAQRRIDALILLLSFLDQSIDLLQQLSAQQYAVVTLGFAVDDLDRVEAGFGSAMPQLMDHLFALGHRRIGFVYGVGSPNMATMRLRLFRQAYHQHGFPFDEALLIHCDKSMEDSYRATQTLLAIQPRPTAIITVNDLLAMGALRAIHEAGLRVPQDISVAGFDDIAMASYLTPPLTTVRANAQEIGRQAARLALARIQQPDLPVQTARVEAELVVRASTGPAPTT